IRIADAPLAQGSFPIRREAARAAIGAGLSVTACLMPGAVWAQDEARVVGLWKLVSYEVEARADGTKLPAMGERPTGYVIFTP
ncbi:lipocalin-like domain-containing protein, partial [Stenotrophomonas maltophilia]